MPQAKAVVSVAFTTRVSVETDELRRRLQAETGLSLPRLIDESLKWFADTRVDLKKVRSWDGDEAG